jgi:hypothetical protein
MSAVNKHNEKLRTQLTYIQTLAGFNDNRGPTFHSCPFQENLTSINSFQK